MSNKGTAVAARSGSASIAHGEGAARALTIFTAVNNRLALLARTYSSLNGQTCHDFEWVIVDDGSTEDVAGCVRGWQQAAQYPIRYLAQEHSGKHRAHNFALTHARGTLFAPLDSDDELLPHAVERLLFHWNAIPSGAREHFSGVTGLCLDSEGRLVGRAFPSDILDCPHDEAMTTYGARGEKWGCHRTDILRAFLFPEIAGEYYCPEALIWNRIARTYRVRHVNEALRIFHSHPEQVTQQLRRVLMRNAGYARLYYLEALNRGGPPWRRFANGINYVRYSLHGWMTPRRVVREFAAQPLMLACAIAGGLLYLWDRLKHGGRS